jgi:hypothetical protein
MSDSQSRNRLVVFRVTQGEYDSLKEACSEKGGRNLSEFTRSELLNAARSDSLGGVIEKRFSEVERRLSGLQDSVEQIANRLETGARCDRNQDE